MKTLLRFAPIVLIIFAVACSKKTVPTSSTSANPPTAATVNTMAIEIQKGKDLCADKCVQCHRLHLPNEYNREQWDDILPKMFTKAKSDTSEQRLIRQYVYANI